MAPWGNKLFSSASSNHEPGPGTAGLGATSPTRTRVQSRVTEADILDNAYGIPTLSHGTLRSSSSNSRQTASHGRSMSHPFPSLFAGRKKHHSDAAADFESTDDDSISPGPSKTSLLNPSVKQSKVPDKDLMTGKCMTCDSMVRWPKDLKVFRCTVCLTINDLKPVVLETRHGDGHRAVKTGTHPVSAYTQHVAPLSIAKTGRLIDQCVTEYLLGRLKHDDGNTSGSPPQPILQGGDITRGDGPGRLHTKAQNIVQPPATISSMPHSRLPINQANERSSFRRESSDRQSSGGHRRAQTVTFSASASGSFFSTHVEQKRREPYSSMPKDAAAGDHQGYSDAQYSADTTNADQAQRERAETTRNIFKPLEDYIITSFGAFECINNSFSNLNPNLALRTASEGSSRTMNPLQSARHTGTDEVMSELDAKTLLLGDVAENGSWWTGGMRSPERSRRSRNREASNDGSVTLKSPRIDWADVNEWYHLVLNAGRFWRRKLDDLMASELHELRPTGPPPEEMDDIEAQLMEAREHTQRVLLKATENLLKRPGRPLLEPNDLRFLLIILANPLLYPAHASSRAKERSRSRSRSRDIKMPYATNNPSTSKKRTEPLALASSNGNGVGSSGKHSGIIKRILGLLSNVPNECHHHLVSWFARYSDSHFQRTTDLIGSFVTYRLTRQHGKKHEVDQDPTAGLIPNMSGTGRTTSAALHAALGVTGQAGKKRDGKPQTVIYNDDWQIRAAARVMALLFSANNSGLTRRGDTRTLSVPDNERSIGLAARERAHRHGQILPTSDFYNTLLDYSDLIADFEAWEARRGKFTFCQYPFFLSIWAKIQIMEHDARRQMEVKAREAFFDSIMTHKTVNQYLVLKIRRECLVEDSLKGVSEVVGSGDEEIKKGLRIEFKGEEGIDAGGLRKEWFLLLVRDVFNPDHGMFTYDEDSRFCYFNPNSFETTDQFFLVGVVLGLAIYNSTILDVALPPFAFRKLLAAGPAAAPGATSHAKPLMTYTLEDLAEYRPALAAGLRQLLEFDGDVENTFCRDFVADVERYGQTVQVPLCPDGEKKPVTNSNRREFVDLYVRYLLDTAVSRQFEPFKRGFFTVCGGNALSLFRPEEIELLIRGSDEPLDIASLRAVAICENWGVPNAAETEPVIQWFWQSFQTANPKDQRKLLSFITGSDRIPAMGATNLVIKLSCLGDDSPRFPVARTCFNMLSLWRYSSRQKLETMLWRAVKESEGFGLK